MNDAAQLQDQAAVFGCEIPKDRAALLLAYLDAMLEENKHINLTAIRDREAAVVFHALDSLAMGSSVFDLAHANCLDIGTGNGFPGVAIACLFPEAKVVLMDRTLKKLKAIERALAVAGFDPGQFEIVQADAAEAPSRGYKAAFDLITVRAVGPPKEMGMLAVPILSLRGQLLCWLSAEPEAAEDSPLGLAKRAELEYTLPAPADRLRRLACFA